MIIHRDNGILCLMCDDLTIKLYDIVQKKLIRLFNCFEGMITDCSFSPNGRWLYSVSSDSCLRVFDIPSSKCIDWVYFEECPVSVTVNVTGEYIATSHVDNLGISLWVNKIYFDNVDLNHYATKPCIIIYIFKIDVLELPHNSSLIESNGKEMVETINITDGNNNEENNDNNNNNTKPLSNDLITLAGSSKPQWTTLINLDSIKERNKPIEPPKEPEKAPFFLPTITGVKPAFDIPDFKEKEEEEKNKQQVKSHIIENHDMISKNNLHQLLDRLYEMPEYDGEEEDNEGNDEAPYVKVMEYLMTLSSSGIDFQLQTLCNGKEDVEGLSALKYLLCILDDGIDSKLYFELIQAVLGRIMVIYSDLLNEDVEFKELLEELHNKENKMMNKISSLIDYNICLLKYFGNIQF